MINPAKNIEALIKNVGTLSPIAPNKQPNKGLFSHANYFKEIP